MSESRQAQCPFGFDSPAGSKDSGIAVFPAMPRALLPEMSTTPIEPGAGGLPTGRCLCGAVSFKINEPVEKVFANYDEASRRWTGGIPMTIMVRAASLIFHGWGRVVQYAGSHRDRCHCFCRTCGSSLFIRHVKPEMMNGMLSLSVGALDSFDGLILTAETHADLRPEFLAFAGDVRGISASEVDAVHGSSLETDSFERSSD